MTVATTKAAAASVRPVIQKLEKTGSGFSLVAVMSNQCWLGANTPVHIKAPTHTAAKAANAQLVKEDLKKETSKAVSETDLQSGTGQ